MRAKSRIDEDWEETDPNYRIKRVHGRKLIDRLAKLTGKGYRLNLQHFQDGLGIPLKHPNKKMPLLELWDDGLVNDQWPSNFVGRDNERTIFEPEDNQGFDWFVASVPEPNWIEKIRDSTVEETLSAALAYCLLWGLILAFGYLGERVWHWLGRVWS